VVSYPILHIVKLMSSVLMDLYWAIDPYGLSLDVYTSIGMLFYPGRRHRS
jgi:hypothetical protein